MQTEPTFYRRLIAGQTGAWSLPLRGFLRTGEWIYTQGVVSRNLRYDKSGPSARLPIPVISVGNITAGGTGKTPLVMDLIQRLDDLGKSPAVVSRGYKAVPGEPNDEEQMIRRRCPSVIYLANSDRAAGAWMAHQRHGADVIILDDGFQHRRLARDLDIVLIDTTCPFGYDHLLPRGLLREPLRALRRADVIIMTRCDQMAHSKLQQVETRLAKLAPAALRLKCNHVVIGVERLDGEPISKSLEGVPVVVVAGIGQPGAFLHTVHTLGAEVVGARWWPDHHHYTKGDLETLFKPGSFPPHEYILTTEKDAVKISKLTGINTAMIGVVRIAIDFMGNDGTMLQKRLLEALAQEVKA